MLALALFVLSALITLLVLVAGAGERVPAQSSDSAPEAESPRDAGSLFPGSAGRGAVSVGEFLLDEPRIGEDPPYILRPPTPRWTQQQVERYWVPLKDVILEIISGQSDRRIDELLQGVD